MENAAENERLSAYLDGELTAAEQARVEQLLAASPAARQLLDELRTLSTTLQSLPQEKLGEDLGPLVLRLAERRMLTEPPSADAQAQPAKFPLPSWRETLRGMLGPRALLWSGLAVAIAVMLMLWHEPEQAAKRELAKGQPPAAAQSPAPSAARDENANEKLADQPEAVSLQAAPGSPAEAPRKNFAAEKRSGRVGEPSGLAVGGHKDDAGWDANRLAKEEQAAPGMGHAVNPAERPSSAIGAASSAPKKGEVANLLAFEKRNAAGKGDESRQSADSKKAEREKKLLREEAAGQSAKDALAANVANVDRLDRSPDAARSKFRARPAAPAVASGAAAQLGGAGGGQPAERAYVLAKPGSQTGFGRGAGAAHNVLVVRCDVAPAAFREHAFDKLLSSNGLVATPQEQDRSNQAKGKAASPQDLVHVAATPAQIVAILAQLAARHDAFPAVSIEPSGGGAPWQQGPAQYNRHTVREDESDASIGMGDGRLQATSPPMLPPGAAQQAPATAAEGGKKGRAADDVEGQSAGARKGTPAAKQAAPTYRVLFVLRRVDLPAPPADTAPAKQKQ
jgi:hypothetical protein